MEIVRGFLTKPVTVRLGDLAGGTCFRLPNAIVEDGCGVYMRLSIPSNMYSSLRVGSDTKLVAHLGTGRIYVYDADKVVIPVEAAAHVALPKEVN